MGRYQNLTETFVWILALGVVFTAHFSFHYFDNRQYKKQKKIDIIVLFLVKLAEAAFFTTSYIAIINSYFTRRTEEKIYKKVYIIFVKMEQFFKHKMNFQKFLHPIKIKFSILLSFEIGFLITLIGLNHYGLIYEGGYNWHCIGITTILIKLISLKFIFLVDLMRFFLMELSIQLNLFSDQELQLFKTGQWKVMSE